MPQTLKKKKKKDSQTNFFIKIYKPEEAIYLVWKSLQQLRLQINHPKSFYLYWFSFTIFSKNSFTLKAQKSIFSPLFANCWFQSCFLCNFFLLWNIYVYAYFENSGVFSLFMLFHLMVNYYSLIGYLCHPRLWTIPRIFRQLQTHWNNCQGLLPKVWLWFIYPGKQIGFTHNNNNS